MEAMTRFGRRALFAIIAAILTHAAVLEAQSPPLAELTAEPEETGDLFLRSVRAIRWGTAAQFMHARALERFQQVVTAMADADTTGSLRLYLTQADSIEYPSLDAATVFDRSIGAMIDDMPGLMHAIYDRDDEFIGAVTETADAAHVVYRTTARISGAVSEVKVMQLSLTPGGWRVLWSDELDVLDAALRGVGRRGPPGN